MTLAEIGAIVAIILIWGLNNVASKVATEALPPLLTGALRFALAALLLAPFLRPPFPQRRALTALVLLAALHFALVYVAFAIAQDVTPLAVSLQLWIPLTTLVAWLWLGETITVAAIAGLAVAFAGIVVMTLDSHAFEDWPAILLGVAASGAWAMATVLARRTQGVSPLKMQGLLALGTAPLLGIGSAVFEPHAVDAIPQAGWLVWASIGFGALVSSVIATGALFWLVQRREAGRVTPYLLATPVVSMLLGVGLMGDVVTPQILLGAGATIGGVGLVALAERGLRSGAARG
jgi:O-acetylserine/cysteine efflux transporter